MAAQTRRRLGKGLSEMFAQPVAVDPPQPAQADADAEVNPAPADATTPPGDEAPARPGDRPAAAPPAAERNGQADRHGEPGIAYLALTTVSPNRYQPRQRVDDASLDELADSIRTHGIMQPIVVRPAPAPGRGTAEGDGEAQDAPTSYELIAGERRWRAAQRAGLEHVPAIVREIDDREAAEWALVENLQREDLNPIDRASAFARLVERFGLTHDRVAERVGVDRSTVANLIRLLALAPMVQDLVRDGRLSMGQARAIAGLSDHAAQQAVADRAVRQSLSVRQVEKLVKSMAGGPAPDTAPPPASPKPAHHLGDLEKQIGEQLGTRVSIRPGRKKGTGKLTIEFYSLDAFDDLLGRLGVQAD